MTLLMVLDHADYGVTPSFYREEAEAVEALIEIAQDHWNDRISRKKEPVDSAELLRQFYGEENSGYEYVLIPDIEYAFPTHEHIRELD